MKKLILCCILSIVTLVSFSQFGDEKIDSIKNDADWQTLAQSQGAWIDAFVNGDMNLSTFNFNDTTAFLGVLGMTLQAYNAAGAVNQTAAAAVREKFNLTGGDCDICDLSPTAQIDSLRSILIYYRNNPIAYAAFRQHSLGIGTPPTEKADFACCGWRFYLCGSLCLLTAPGIGTYILCIAYCASNHCCNPLD